MSERERDETKEFKTWNFYKDLHFWEEASKFTEKFSEGEGILMPVDRQLVWQPCNKTKKKYALDIPEILSQSAVIVGQWKWDTLYEML